MVTESRPSKARGRAPQQCGVRPARPAASADQAQAQRPRAHLHPPLLRARRGHLRGHLPRSHGDVVLLRHDAMDPLQHDVHRPGQLQAVLLRAGPAQRAVAHRRVRDHHQRPEGRAGPAARGAPDLDHPGARRAPLPGVLPGPRQHRRGGPHLRCALDTGYGPGRHRPVLVRDPRARLARQPEHRAPLRRVRRRLEGRRPGHGHLHRGSAVHSAGVLRGRRRRRRRGLEQVLEHHPPAQSALRRSV